jgi:hypothetical protein
MTAFNTFCEAVEASALARIVMGLDERWTAVIQTLHLVAMAVLVASITTFDLRLLGLSMKRVSVSRLADRLLPATWTAFGLMIFSGGFMFVAKAQVYCVNPVFTTKLFLIFLAGVNMALFHFTIYRNVSKWDENTATPFSAKLVGSISVILWASVVVAGRWIGFVS